jgi:DNA mismatch endonuclease (patch repair protein)
MTDILTREQRSNLMRRILGRNTKPELAVRKAAHALGYRYSLHKKGLPGSPDIVFVSRKKIIFVHGCFWHAHRCKNWRHPTTRPKYWAMRFENNQARDRTNQAELRGDGWKILVIWECETKDAARLSRRLERFLR